METVYLKSKKGNKTFVKITNKNVIELWVDRIKWDDLDNSIQTEKQWHIENYNMEVCTRDEFNEFHMQLANEINEILIN